MFPKIRFAILKRKIKHNPYIGEKDIEGDYLFKADGYSIRYRVINLPNGKIDIAWLSWKYRFSPFEERLRRLKEGFFDFWHYQKWMLFFRPGILLALTICLLFFYFEVIERQETKIARLKWMIASAVGVTPQDIQYIGDGWLEISGQRKIPEKGINEPIKYKFNPLRWLFFSEGGFLRRWRGEPFGYATHPICYNQRGDVWINKEGAWKHGRIAGENIKWDTPVGSIKVIEQEQKIYEDKKLKVIDREHLKSD